LAAELDAYKDDDMEVDGEEAGGANGRGSVLA